ncbi:hypothetical protein A6456_37765 [Paraburkholderia tropica]|nr:hypothetical protein A6456_37765 [Paraburkholderia tropica]
MRRTGTDEIPREELATGAIETMGNAARHDPLYLRAMRVKCLNHRLSTPRISAEMIFERLE